MSFPSALLRRLPFFTVKRKVEAHQPASAPAAVPEQVSAPIEAACGDSSADVGTSRQIGSSRKDEVRPQASAGVGTPQHQSSDSGMPKAVASADVGMPRRLLEEDLGSFAFTPHDDEKIHPDQYQLLRFLPYGDIADEFVKWVQSSPRTAFLRGWPVTVDEVWDLAYSVFQHETNIAIESRNNFLAALSKHPHVKREKNKRIRSERDDRRWDKVTVYRFLTADQIAAQAKKDLLKRVA